MSVPKQGKQGVHVCHSVVISKQVTAVLCASDQSDSKLDATLCLCRECHFRIGSFASNRGYLSLDQPRLFEQDPGRFKWQQLHHQLYHTPAGTSLLVADPLQLIQLLADSKSHQPVQHRRQGERSDFHTGIPLELVHAASARSQCHGG